MRSVFEILLAVSLALQQAAPREAARGRATQDAGQVGTAHVSGVIVNDQDPAQPVRRATVRLTLVPSTNGSDRTRTVVTDDDGVFSADGLSPGQYRVSASCAGLVTMAWGARRYGQPGSVIALSEKQHLSDLRIVLPRGAAISGIITNTSGEPAANVTVVAMRAGVQDGERQLVAASSARDAGATISSRTDERGEYRLHGLPEGGYGIVAIARSSVESGAAFSEVYYPGTPERARAGRVNVRPGEERAAINIALHAFATAKIEGTVVGQQSGGRPTRLCLVPDGPFGNGVTADPDGRFVFAGIPSGDYSLQARLRDAARKERLWGQTMVTMNGQSLTGVAIVLQRPMTLRGRIVLADAAAPAAVDLSHVSITFTEMYPWQREPTLPALVAADGAFTIEDVTPGKYRVTVSTPPLTRDGRPLTAASVMMGGRDVLDTPAVIDLSNPGDVLITLTNLTQEVSGIALDARGEPVPSVDVVMFPASPALWTALSRRIRMATSASDGRYVLTEVPVGEYRLAVAVSEPDDITDPLFLHGLVPASVALTLTPGAKHVQDVRAIAR